MEDSPLTGGRILDVCGPPAKEGVTGLYFVLPHLLQGKAWNSDRATLMITGM